MPAEKPLPHNLDAERSVLGAILLDNQALATVSAVISGGDFFLKDNGTIYREMLALRDAGSPIDLLTLSDFMVKRGSVCAPPYGVAYIASLVDGVPRIGHVEHYAKIIKETSRLRLIAKIADSITRKVMNASSAVSPSDLERELRESLRELPPIAPVLPAEQLTFGLTEFLAKDFPIEEQLVEGFITRGATAMIVALPHRLKSWFTTALALGCTRAGTVMGSLQVNKPVRTLLVQLEDFPSTVKKRITDLVGASCYDDIEPDNFRIMPRCDMKLPDEEWYQKLKYEVMRFPTGPADLVIIDVLRRLFRGDINSPKETAEFLEVVDRLRHETGCAVMLVHHENKKDSELMTAAAGSYNLPGWAQSMIQFKKKAVEGEISRVEIEVDNKLAPSPEPMRMILDLKAHMPVRLEPLEDGVGATEAEERLGSEWTVRDLAEALEINKSNAHRRLKKWMALGKAEKIQAGKRGRTGGLARYRFVDNGEPIAIAPSVPIRRIQ